MTGITAADASALTQSTLAADIGMAVAKKSLDHQKQQGAAVLSLLDTAAQTATQPIQPGKGIDLDVTE